MLILGIESSCDETAAAVVEDGRTVLSNVINSQIDIHRVYGGVVPEIASRMHAENISYVAEKAVLDADISLNDIDAVAVTYAPGLIGALLVGINFAKGLSFSLGKPLIPVHHIRGHIAANYIVHKELEPPFMCLVVSGGHSHIIFVKDYTDFEVLGATRDDAAGEAFDKAARVLGLSYPGGVLIDALSKKGDKNSIKFPEVHFKDNPYDFSFSGLKTSVINYVHNAKQKGEEISKENVAASFSKSVCDVLCGHFLSALSDNNIKKAVLAGGVSANSMLRDEMGKMCAKNGIELFIPPLELCTDNAAMIACQGYYEYLSGKRGNMYLNGIASLDISK